MIHDVVARDVRMSCDRELRTDDYISTMPPELLANIFQLAHQPGQPEGEDEDEDVDETPASDQLASPTEVVLSHVNLYWRNVALTTRVLWRHITIEQKEPLEKIRAYLGRSGPRTPLHLRLDVRREIPALTEILHLVFQHLDRWERVTIHSNLETSELPIVSRLYDVSAPILEHLGLCVHDVDSANIEALRRADFEQILTQGCPRLTVLRLRGLSMHFFRPPITNITTLHLEQTRGLFLGYESFKNLLIAAPALAHLSIHDTIIDELVESWPPGDCIPLPNLVSLRISFPGTLQHVFSDILISISAPRLESLVLKEVGQDHLDRFLELPGVSTKFPSLRSLTFCDFDYQDAERLALMCAALPKITEFTCIHTTAYPPTVLVMMAGKSDVSVPGSPNGDPWPDLHTFNTNLDVDDLGLLRIAVERRKMIGYPLRVLRISGIDEYDLDEETEETFDWLEENLTVERFATVERWPPGSDYDPDDTLFT
ncbi:hypothetical protein DFH06DRAFT_1036248 [Mycena polygramma]|nr:hypothetical protein DFH06DRAFT_1036248 [Mycena polygramma]